MASPQPYQHTQGTPILYLFSLHVTYNISPPCLICLNSCPLFTSPVGRNDNNWFIVCLEVGLLITGMAGKSSGELKIIHPKLRVNWCDISCRDACLLSDMMGLDGAQSPPISETGGHCLLPEIMTWCYFKITHRPCCEQLHDGTF